MADPTSTIREYPPTLGMRALEIAQSKVGQRERGGKNRGAIVTWSLQGLHSSSDTPKWCAFFACQTFLRAAQTPEQLAEMKKIASGDCDRLWARLAARGWTWIYGADSLPPPPGALIFFGAAEDLNHVGLVVEPEGEEIVTIEGNGGPKADRVVQARRRPGVDHVHGFAEVRL